MKTKENNTIGLFTIETPFIYHSEIEEFCSLIASFIDKIEDRENFRESLIKYFLSTEEKVDKKYFKLSFEDYEIELSRDSQSRLPIMIITEKEI